MHQLLDPMTRLGVPVVVLLARSVAEVMDNLRLVGRAAGVPERGEAVAAALEARLAGIEKTAPVSRPRVAMITGRLGNGLVLIARADTYTGDAIVKAGGRHALERSIVAHVSPEAIVAADPDVLLFAGTKADLDALVPSPAGTFHALCGMGAPIRSPAPSSSSRGRAPSTASRSLQPCCGGPVDEGAFSRHGRDTDGRPALRRDGGA